MKKTIIVSYISAISMLFGCQDNTFQDLSSDENLRISLSSEIEQECISRVNDSGFCDGDVMGVYIVDYDGNNPGTLLNSGNRGDNVRHTFDEANYKWNSAYDLFWKDKHTNIDVYGYYPFANPEDVNNYNFTIEKDQSKSSQEKGMGGYEASDFLWGKAEDIAPTTSVIRLPMTHRMANARVTLVEGSGFAEGEWANTTKQVLVTNLTRESVINLADGSVKIAGSVSSTATIPARVGDEWRAIVVPQTVKSGTTLFSITIAGVPYTFKKSEDFTYISGKMSNFSIKVDKKDNSGQYTLTLISESITAWESDIVSHDGTAREYLVIRSTAGGLHKAIDAAKKDFRKIKNLKITGMLDSRDFYFMRDSMDALQALNLKEVRIKGYGESSVYHGKNIDDQIPGEAFYDNSTIKGKLSLTRIVLPDTIKSIGNRAFSGCENLTGSLIIPEGVVEIQQGAFTNCKNLNGTLSLPSTLIKLGNFGDSDKTDTEMEGNDYYSGVFQGCTSFTGNLNLPDKIELIRGYCFAQCRGFYGDLRLPEKLKRLGVSAFGECSNLTGSLSIPQGISDIPQFSFYKCGFNGTLTLHDGIISIGNDAFNGCHFKGELALPKNLQVISDNVFYGNDFSGELKLPSKLSSIGKKAFAYNWRLMGILEFPQDLQSIGEGAFAQCRMIEGLVFPEAMETIRSNPGDWDINAIGAFQGCYGIGTIVCKGEMPPYVQDNSFEGVAKDNFTLEVPESSIAQYQSAQGWKEFKRIAAHHELVCRPSIACAINTRHQQTLVINAEGDWEVQSKPDWCELSQTSGSKKTKITLTIAEMAKGSDTRTGEIIFRLKGKEYTHKCTVSQYNYDYAEDEIITLQKATKGNNGGINLVFLGDGYNGKDISEGNYLKDMKEQVENFFSIEPYKTYRDYFNVYTEIALSQESGIGTINTIRYVKFETTYTGGVGLRCDYDAAFNYALRIPSVTKSNLNQSLIIITPNSTDYGGICQMWTDGSAIAFCPMSTYGYPLDTRGVIQHEAGGHGFGKLGDEYIYHNEFIDFCKCTCCPHVDAFLGAKSLGWYDNLSLTGKMHEVPWSHLIFDSRYSDIVDIYEGGYMHSRGVFRSEQNSCMNNNIPYYNTISRESIVKRIKKYAGEEYNFEDFVANDKRDAGVASRSISESTSKSVHTYQMPPVIHKGSPLNNKISNRSSHK